MRIFDSNLIGLKKIISDTDVIEGIDNPPHDTRAYFRGICLQKWPESIVSANWDSLVFRLEGDQLKRIPILDPSEGSFEKVQLLLERATSPSQMIEEIESSNK